MAKMRPKVAKMRLKMAKMRPQVVKMRLNMAMLKLEMAKMTLNMSRIAPRWALYRPQIPQDDTKMALKPPKKAAARNEKVNDLTFKVLALVF